MTQPTAFEFDIKHIVSPRLGMMMNNIASCKLTQHRLQDRLWHQGSSRLFRKRQGEYPLASITISRIFQNAKYAEIVNFTLRDGRNLCGKVVRVHKNKAIMQVYGDTSGMDVLRTRCEFSGDVMRMAVSEDMLGRVFDGSGKPLDHGPPVVGEEFLEIDGQPINPYCFMYPENFIQTGISAIDLTCPLAQGTRLPFFSASGLPHNEVINSF